MLLCSKKRSAGVTVDWLMQRHRCWLHNWQMSIKKASVTLQWFGWFGIWIWMNASSQIAKWSTAVIRTQWVLKQVPGGTWKDFSFTLLNLYIKKKRKKLHDLFRSKNYLVSLFFTNKAMGGSKDNSLRKPSLNHLKLLDYNGIHTVKKNK